MWGMGESLKKLTITSLKEILRILPILILIVVAIKTHRGDYEQIMFIIYVLAQIGFVVIFVHFLRKFQFPYINLQSAVTKAMETSTGALGIVICIFVFMMFLVFVTVARAGMTDEEILSKAEPYIPIVQEAFENHWPDAPYKEYEGGKIEQETCVNLKKCWNPKVELKTSREWGFGLSQMTIAYNPDGSVRFNKFEEAKAAYRKQLAGWELDDRYNPRYHIIFSVLESRAGFKKFTPLFSTDTDRWAGSMIAYNAGAGTVLKRRAVCLRTEDCDPSKWFGGLDTVQYQGENKLLYGVSLKIRRDAYPRNIIFKRSLKYKGYF